MHATSVRTSASYEQVKELFERYRLAYIDDLSSSIGHLCGEGLARLRQLVFIVYKVREFELKFNHAIFLEIASKDTSHKRSNAYSFEMEMLVESFYYFGYRLICTLHGLPNLSKFSVDGIDKTRNLLLEHPEGSKMYGRSFVWGMPTRNISIETRDCMPITKSYC